jgi:head-tail adaptor
MNTKGVSPAGAYRHVVQIQQNQAVSSNAAGEVSPVWVTIIPVLHADVELTGGSEVEDAGQMTSLQNYMVKHRYYAGLTSSYRYLWVQPATPYPVLNIVDVVADAKKIEHTATCISRDLLS